MIGNTFTEDTVLRPASLVETQPNPTSDRTRRDLFVVSTGFSLFSSVDAKPITSFCIAVVVSEKRKKLLPTILRAGVKKYREKSCSFSQKEK